MGLRFRKSIKIAPGLRLNLSKTGVSLTAGTRGFHKTIHTSGRVTTSLGLPGSGLSYVDTKYIGRNKKQRASARKAADPAPAGNTTSARLAARSAEEAEALPAVPEMPDPAPEPELPPEPPADFHPAQLTDEALRGIHRDADAPVDWIRLFRSPEPPSGAYDPELWAYYHRLAPRVLEGDIDAYLTVIRDAAPLDDLLAYGGEFQFGTDDPSRMEVEFVVNEEALKDQRLEKNVLQYFDLLQDYVCSVTIRMARDLFALLPVSDVAVHAVLGGQTVLSACFDKETMDRIPFGAADPSDTLAQFEHRMDFQPTRGFAPVERISTGTAG